MGARPQIENLGAGSALRKWLGVTTPTKPPREPTVTRGEIAGWYARQLAPCIHAQRQELGRPGILVVRCREPGFHDDLRDSLEAVLSGSLDCDVLSIWPEDADAVRAAARETVDALNAGRTRVFVLPHERVLAAALPPVDLVLAIPRFNSSNLAQACQTFLDLPEPPVVPSEPWVAQVTPVDLLISSEVRGDPIPAIRAAVRHRLRKHDCSDATPMESLLGLNEVRTWAAALIEDIRDALDPQIRCHWSDIERAVVFAGPRGVGRSSLTRAIARATGLHWLNVSANRWTAAQEIEDAFDNAHALAPAILVVEDLGNLDPHLAPELGRQIARHDDREPLLVVGTCTDDDVPPDEVLKQAGFEHTIYLPLPNAQVLAHQLDKCLADIPHQLNETQMRQVGRLALGGTAADLGLHLRHAQKIARRAGHELLEFGDLAAAILETPAVPARPKISDDELAMTAHHEAGHAVMQFLEIAGGRQLQYVTIVPRRMGAGTALGFVLRQPEEDRVSMSRDEGMALIRSFLGGRAAEELLRGRGQVTTGAGGGQTSDLAIATRLASFLVGRCGLGDRGSLVYRSAQPEDDPHLAGQVDALLRRQYRRTMDRLRDHWHLVTALAARLLQDQELSGDEARAVLRQSAEARPPVGNTRTPARWPPGVNPETTSSTD